MPADDDDDTGSDDETNPVRQLRQEVKRLKAEAAGNKQAADEVSALRRELSFAKAGIPAEHPMRSIFEKGYDGEDSAEAIKTAWSAAGLPLAGAGGQQSNAGGQQQQQQSDAGQSQADIDANRQMDDALGGGTGGGDDINAFKLKLEAAGTDWEAIDKVVKEYSSNVRLLD